MPVTVRPCRLDECATVLDLWRQAEAIPRRTDTLPDVERMVREHPGTLRVAEENGRLSAMAARDEPQAVGFWETAPGWQREPRWHRYAKDL